MRITDSHVHLWRIGGPGQTWPDAQWPILYRDFGPSDLLQALSGASATATSAGSTVEAVVLVQSQPDDRDTDWLLEVATGLPLVAAVVGWVDLASTSAPARIAAVARHPKLRGLRPMLQGIEETEWLLRPELEPALQAMMHAGLRFDALIQPRHLPMLRAFAARWPDLPIVIDHGAKPRITHGELDPWRAQMTALSHFRQVHCKLSGLRTEQAAGAPRAELQPYMLHLLNTFQDRLMWGSDWPVLLHSQDQYADWLNTSLELAASAAAGAVTAESLFRTAASRFYGL
jgi:L-fuconolactonase